MEHKQPKQNVKIEPKPVEKVEERRERRLRLDTLETRVAPSALWGIDRPGLTALNRFVDRTAPSA